MIYVRSLIFNILFYSLIAIGCAIICLTFFMPKKWFVILFSYGVLPLGKLLLRIICGLKIEVRGLENINQDKALYAIKHQSALDTYCITSIVKNAVMVLKKELTYIPVFGWAQAIYGLISVDRGNGSTAMKKMLKDAKSRVEKNRPIIIFPEGTRTKPGTKTAYKPGIYFIANGLNVPVIPVALNTGLFWEKHSFLRHKGKVVIEFLPKMQDNLNKQEFMEKLEDVIESKCKELNAEAIKNYPAARTIFNKHNSNT